MSDFANRLRQYEPEDISMAGLRVIIREAAAEIERLEGRLAEYEATIRVLRTVAAAERECCARMVDEFDTNLAAKIRARAKP